MNKGRSIGLRSLILFFLSFVVVVALVNKIFEWNTINNLINASNENLAIEFSEIEKDNIFFNTEANPLLEEIYSDKIKNPNDYIVVADKIRAKIAISEDMDKNYIKLLQDNKEKILKFKYKKIFLLGNARKYVSDFVSSSLSSYDETIKLSNKISIDNKFVNDYFLVSRDMAVSNDFSRRAPTYYDQSMVKFVQNNYTDLGVLEKYTKEDFKFNDEDSYKNNNPYGYEILIKYRDYLKTYYLIMKDLASGDIDSATYKYSKFQSQAIDLNIDYEKLFGEGTKNKNEISQSGLLEVAKTVRTSKDYDSNGINEYPILGKVNKYKGDLALCGLYGSKIELFESITSEYPSSKDSVTIVEELSKIGPKTEFVDDLFDYDALKIISNDDKSIKYQCVDNISNVVYEYEVLK